MCTWALPAAARLRPDRAPGPARPALARCVALLLLAGAALGVPAAGRPVPGRGGGGAEGVSPCGRCPGRGRRQLLLDAGAPRPQLQPPGGRRAPPQTLLRQQVLPLHRQDGQGGRDPAEELRRQ
ncbi:hypothetical protein ANANG_G00092530 [Anguilla anguilla]|uniref:Uncharacterized protein n=1 Tax=Anguilla anguilla TaxID=7936 RepID=A0A9D3S611_ANGAN|nr:hypothetical protein ANANG_G00092530 [Anguilla anguilla]